MSRPARPASRIRVLGLAGPDGSGKSTVAGAVRDLATARGIPTRTTYLYGCVICRHLRPPRRPVRLRRLLVARGTADLETPHAAPDDPRGRRAGAPSLPQRLHAHVEAVELGIRLAFTVRRTARTGHHGPPPLLLTDRTPLDAMVKHDLPPASPAAHHLGRLLDRFTLIAVLDAPAEQLAARDREHTARGLAAARSGYRRWCTGRDRVRCLSTADNPPESLARRLLNAVYGP